MISEHMLLCQNPEAAKVSAYLLYLLSVVVDVRQRLSGCLDEFTETDEGRRVMLYSDYS